MAWYQAMGSQTVRLLSVKTEAEGVLNDRWEGVASNGVSDSSMLSDGEVGCEESGVLSVPAGWCGLARHHCFQCWWRGWWEVRYINRFRCWWDNTPTWLPSALDLPRHLIAWDCLIHHCLLHPAFHHHLTNHFIHLHPQQSYLLWPHCSPADFLLNLADMFGVGVSTAVEIIECKFKLLS